MKKLLFLLIAITAMMVSLQREATAQCSVTLTQPAQPVISIAATTQASEPSTNGLFTISVTTPVCVATTVTFTVTGTATEGTDFNTIGTTAIIPAGGTSITVPVTVIDDLVAEPNETVIVTITGTNNPVVLTTGTLSATVTINDNDIYTISLAGFTVTETEGTQSQNFVATMTGSAQHDIVLSFNTTAGTATAGSDFTAISGGSATIIAGQTTVSIPVDILGDLIAEPQEAFTGTIAITNANGQQISIPSGSEVATATINDNDVNVTVDNKAACDDATSLALTVTITPNPGGGTVQFYVNGSTVGSPVNVNAGDGTATYTHDPSALTPGGYTIRADFSGFGQYSARSSNGVSDGTLTINPLPTFTTSYTDVTCFGGSDGTITVTIATGPGYPGFPLYQFSLNNGTNYTLPLSSPYTFTGLNYNSGNPYLIRVKDPNGCESLSCP